MAGSSASPRAPAAPADGKRIAYVSDGVAPYLPGGMPEVSRRHIRWLVDAGFDLRIIHTRTAPGEHHELGAEQVIVPWPTASGLARLHPLKYARQLERFSEAILPAIDSWKPDLVYSDGPNLLAYLRRPRTARAPVLFHPHGLNMYQSGNRRLTLLRSYPLRRLVATHCLEAERTISQGGHLTEILRDKIGLDPARIAYLPNTLPLGMAPVGPRTSHQGRFLFLGRNDPLKGLATLLKAFPSQGPTLRVVGAPAPEAGRPANVEFHGEIWDRDAIGRHLAESDFVVVPSLSEGMPTVVLEAFAHGLPVIASDVGAIPQMVVPGKTGFLVAPKRVGDLREALSLAANMGNDEYARLSANCHDSIRTEFAQDHVRASLVQLCRDTMRDA